MAMIAVSCPAYRSNSVVKAGKQSSGTQRYRCQNPACTRTIFQLAYVAHGHLQETKPQIIEMALNGSGIRDTARVLLVSPVTVLKVLKKRGGLSAGQQSSVGHPCFRGHRRVVDTGRGDRSQMRCGPLWARSRPHGGCGMRWIIAPEKS
jgi:transposase-like protein